MFYSAITLTQPTTVQELEDALASPSQNGATSCGPERAAQGDEREHPAGREAADNWVATAVAGTFVAKQCAKMEGQQFRHYKEAVDIIRRAEALHRDVLVLTTRIALGEEEIQTHSFGGRLERLDVYDRAVFEGLLVGAAASRRPPTEAASMQSGDSIPVCAPASPRMISSGEAEARRCAASSSPCIATPPTVALNAESASTEGSDTDQDQTRAPTPKMLVKWAKAKNLPMVQKYATRDSMKQAFLSQGLPLNTETASLWRFLGGGEDKFLDFAAAAAARGDHVSVRCAIEEGVSANACTSEVFDRFGVSAQRIDLPLLYVAAEAGHHRVIQTLIDCGASNADRIVFYHGKTHPMLRPRNWLKATTGKPVEKPWQVFCVHRSLEAALDNFASLRNRSKFVVECLQLLAQLYSADERMHALLRSIRGGSVGAVRALCDGVQFSSEQRRRLWDTAQATGPRILLDILPKP